MTPKQLLKSFSLEEKITQVHAKEIEKILTETLKERDELLEEARIFVKGYIQIKEYYLWFPQLKSAKRWLTNYKKLLDKE